MVCWSRLRRYKSTDVAIRAFDLIRDDVPDARMLVMGRGPDEGRLRRLVGRLGLEDPVSFTGHPALDELVDTLHRAQVFLNPSPKEGWGLTVVEANQCGVPVIASDRPGLRDSVRDGQTGLLVPYGDPRAMAKRGPAAPARSGSLGLLQRCRPRAGRHVQLAALHRRVARICSSGGGRAWPGLAMRRRSTFLGKLLVSAGLLGLCSPGFPCDEVRQALADPRWDWLVAALGVYALSAWGGAMQWSWLLRAAGLRTAGRGRSAGSTSWGSSSTISCRPTSVATPTRSSTWGGASAARAGSSASPCWTGWSG